MINYIRVMQKLNLAFQKHQENVIRFQSFYFDSRKNLVATQSQHKRFSSVGISVFIENIKIESIFLFRLYLSLFKPKQSIHLTFCLRKNTYELNLKIIYKICSSTVSETQNIYAVFPNDDIIYYSTWNTERCSVIFCIS